MSNISSKRIKKEFDLLSDVSPGVGIFVNKNGEDFSIIVKIDNSILPETIRNQSLLQTFNFEISINSNYPFNPPIVFCKDSIINYSFHDGRDFLSEIMESPYAPGITLKEIIQKMPNFISKVISKSKQANKFIFFGKFYSGHIYDLKFWNSLSYARVFPCDFFREDSKEIVLKYLVLTGSALLLCDPIKDKPTSCQLFAWTSIDNINEILYIPETMTILIRFHPINENFIEIMLQTKNAKEIRDVIIQNLVCLGFNYQKNIESHISEESVKGPVFGKDSIDKIEEQILIYESALQTEADIDIVKALMKLYQEAIEYYSEKNVKMSNNYVNRLQSMLCREDVNMILMSMDTEHETSKKS